MRLFYAVVFLCYSINIKLITAQVFNEEYTPIGYFAFQRASPHHQKPPKVRKPPYIAADIDCPGVSQAIDRYSPKHTLCGDINLGFVPNNPMKINVDGQPYPFETIKNKTLQFLANTLPVLKQQIKDIPKVARFYKNSNLIEQTSYLRRGIREIKSNNDLTNNSSEKINLLSRQSQCEGDNKLLSKSSDSYTMGTLESILSSTVIKKLNNCGKIKCINVLMCVVYMRTLKTGLYHQIFELDVTDPDSGDDNKRNAVCELIQTLKEDGLLSKSFMNAVMSTISKAATIGNIASLINQYGQYSSPLQETSQQNHANKSALFEVLSALSTISGTNGYNPLISIIEYIANYQKSAKMNRISIKRKKPSDPEDILREPQELPLTPCSSIDEYVSPFYARNYQGVWKYVVQIPNEGYFTQTIQRTSCLKNTCDLLEGNCRESARWVSLLVAEIFYPEIYIPLNHVLPLNSDHLLHLNNRPNIAQQMFPNQDMTSFHYNLQKRMGSHNKQNDEILLKKQRKIDKTINKLETNTNKSNKEKDGSTKESENLKNNMDCDGYDNIGCYVVRVYYDWFLVNGSCKCWKLHNTSQTNNINEAIKRIFIGKW